MREFPRSVSWTARAPPLPRTAWEKKTEDGGDSGREREQEEPGPTLGPCEAYPTDHQSTPLNLIYVGVAGELSTNVTTVVSVLKTSKSVDIPAPPGEDVVIGAVPHPNPLARARERKKARLLQEASNGPLPPKLIYRM